MNFERINDLIEKYFAGETSLEEEKILRGYFNGSNIDPRLLSYAPLFQFFEREKTVVFPDAKMPKFQETKTVNIQKQPFSYKILRGGNFWKLAATLAFLVVGSVAIFKVFEPKSTPIAQTTRITKKPGGAKMIILDGEGDEKEALAQVNQALALVSKKMKKGTDKTNEGLLKLRDATEILKDNN